MVNSFGGGVISIWTQGCPHHCKGCFNPETWSEDGGHEITEEELRKIFITLEKPYIKGVSFLGGEPLSANNVDDVIDLCRAIKNKFPKKIISIWTGYTLEQLYEKGLDKTYLSVIDYIVDGQFVEELKDKRLKLRGSSNQRIWKNSLGDFINITDWWGDNLD